MKRCIFLTLPVLLLLLAGCSFLPVPKEQRYTEIYKFLEKMDYKSTGQVISETRDNGDGVFTASSLTVEIHGTNSYDMLLQNTKMSFPGLSCSQEVSIYQDCYANGISISITRANPNEQNSVVIVTDKDSGRKNKI